MTAFLKKPTGWYNRGYLNCRNTREFGRPHFPQRLKRDCFMRHPSDSKPIFSPEILGQIQELCEEFSRELQANSVETTRREK